MTGMPSTGSNALETLSDLLSQDPVPKELEITILPFDDDNDTADASSFMKEGIHLGIHAPHVGKLAKEFREIYYDCRTRFISSDDGDTQISPCSYQKHFMESVSCLLLLCPDHATAFADRRRLLMLHQQQIVHTDTDIAPAESYIRFWESEIGFMNMLFTQHSKCPNAWAHRRWICKQMLKSLNELISSDLDLASETLMSWTTREIAICCVIAEKYPKNYYAWTHRSFITRTLANLIQCETQNKKTETWDHADILSLLKTEVDSVEPWLQRHVSDHSAAHYGGEVINLWLQVGKLNQGDPVINTSNIDLLVWKLDAIQEKLKGSQELISKFPSHEVIWVWRRICSRLFLEHADEESGMNFVQEETKACTKTFTMEDESESLTTSRSHHMFSYVLWILKYAYSRWNKCERQVQMIRSELISLEGRVSCLQSQSSNSVCNLSIERIWNIIGHAATDNEDVRR